MKTLIFYLFYLNIKVIQKQVLFRKEDHVMPAPQVPLICKLQAFSLSEPTPSALMGRRSLDYKPKCGFYERFIPSAFVKRSLQEWDFLREKKESKYSYLKKQTRCFRKNEDGERGASLPRFFYYIFNTLNSLKRKTGVV